MKVFCPCCGQTIEIKVSFPGYDSYPDKDITLPNVRFDALEAQGRYFGVTEEVKQK